MLEQISKVPGPSQVFHVVSVKNLQDGKCFVLSTCLESHAQGSETEWGSSLRFGMTRAP